MAAAITLFIIGVIVLLVCSEVVVKAALRMAGHFRLSPLIIGTTVVAVGTSLPELVVSVISAWRGEVGLAVGNLVGSSIINIILVLAAAILIGGMRIGTIKTQRNIWVMIAVTGLFSWLWWRGWSTAAGIILVTVAAGFSLLETIWGVEGRTLEDKSRLKKIKPEGGKWGLLTAVGAGGLVTGGLVTVAAVEKISQLTGYSQTFLGLTLMAVATSLPELLVTITSEEEKEEKVALGNVIGSNIYNLALIGGLVAFFGRPAATAVGGWEFLWLSAVILWLIVSGFKGKVVPRWVGGGLLVLFAAYVWTLAR